ncbi:hypothetical protein IKT64_02905 [Candidatus Saccharibacteria bacterium]|nr:hypothetical protein [Candidatus Saccharibacteria bacterium]
MGKVYTIEVVKSNFRGQLFPAKQTGDLDTQMKVLKVISMFKDAFLDLGDSVSGDKGKDFEVSFGFVFGKGEEILYAIGNGVYEYSAESWRDTLDHAQKQHFADLTDDGIYGRYVKCIEIMINEEAFKGYFEAVCHSDPEQYSMEMTEEVIREVERALAEQEQPIARIAHVF